MTTVPAHHQPPTHRYLFLLWPVAALAACIALWIAAIGRADAEFARADALALKEAGAYAQAYEQYITRSVGQMDQVTMQLKHSWERAGNRSLLEDMKRGGMFTDAAFVEVCILGRDGKVLSSTGARTARSFAGTRFFAQHSNNISSALRIGAAPAELAHGQQAVLFSRRLDTADDEFDGVIVLAVDANYFTSFIGAGALGSDAVLAMVGTEGRLRVEQHGAGAAVVGAARSVLPAPATWASARGERLLQGANGFADAQGRVLGWRHSPSYPLAALVALPHHNALAAAQAYWRDSRNNTIAITVSLVLLSFVAAALSLREAARERVRHRKVHAQELQRLANTDSLTGLQNRHCFLHIAPQVLEKARHEGRELALLFIDLDDFKQVNDSHGHALGDQLLKLAARRLAGLLRTTDQLARFGGDEFVVLLDPCQGDRQVAAVAERIVAAFAMPFAVGEGLVAVIGASVGIARFPHDGQDAPALVRHSDMAMYAGKAEGKGQYRFFDQSLAGAMARRARLKQCLHEAIGRDDFSLAYQPRVDAHTGELLSMEALLRWEHPELGVVPPSEFIPIAEGSGLIAALGELVIDKACAQVAAWRAQGLRVVPVSINVSPRQFGNAGLHRVLCASLERHGIAASLLEVEVTESAMMGECDGIRAELVAIRALGIKLHVDDFGTGYSSLSQLQRLRMDVLKVDRAFTSELGKSREGELFFQAIVSMAHALGMEVVAEGVETAQQLDILRRLGCNEVQGYLVSRPIGPGAMAALMMRRFLLGPDPAKFLPAPYFS